MRRAVGEVLAEIAEANAGELRPRDVVDAAKDPASPMHTAFEWDDQKAAHQHRLNQARQLVRSIRVVDSAEEGEPIRRAFLSIPGGPNGQAYRPLEAVKNSVDLQIAALRAAERDIAAIERRYRDIQEICEFAIEARSKIRERMEKQRKSAEQRPN